MDDQIGDFDCHEPFHEHRNRLRNASSIKTSQRQMFIYFINRKKKMKLKTFELIENSFFLRFSLNESQPELETFKVVSTSIWWTMDTFRWPDIDQ